MKTDEQGLIVLEDNGSDVATFARDAGGWLLLAVRAETLADLNAVAQQVNVLEEVTDDEGNTRLVRASSDIHYDGPFYPVIEKAVLDEEGTVVTPAVVDSRPHANILVGARSQQKEDEQGRKRWAVNLLAWMQNGTPLTADERNRSENGRKYANTTLLDPTSFTPQRVFAR